MAQQQDGPQQVENRYRTELGWALPGARAQGTRVTTAFERASTALANGAWDSTVAADFAQVLGERASAASTAAQDCVAALEGRHRREPVQVAEGDRRARWS